MKNKRLGLLHTTAALVPVFQKLCSEVLPNVEVFNIVDDSLIKDVISQGSLTPHISRRVARHIESAEQAGADFVLVTCSSIGAAVEAAIPFSSVPLMRVDLPMAERAIELGPRIGVIATLSTTLTPTQNLIERRAELKGKTILLKSDLCAGAFEALLQSDTAMHDSKVSAAIARISLEVDVIVLAQASMARVVAQLPPDSIRVPILSSPALALEHIALVLAHSSNAHCVV